MELGVGYLPTHDGLRPREIARRVGERGHCALWFAEHTHIPASRETPWPGGARLPQKYWHTYDLFVALARADRHLQLQMLSVPPDPRALERCEKAGFQRASVWLPSGPWGVVEPALEKWERAIGELVGR